MFSVGQKVVCVNDKEFDDEAPNVIIIGDMNGLKEGNIYTIREIFIDPVWGDAEVKLEEIIRPDDSYTPSVGFYESGFHYSRFRPVVRRETDISIFKEILRDCYASC